MEFIFLKSHRREFPDGSALSPGSTGDEVGVGTEKQRLGEQAGW